MPDKIKIADIRAKFPMYSDLSDEQLLSGIKQKYYADIPDSEFRSRIEFNAPSQQQGSQEKPGVITSIGAGLGRGVGGVALGAQELLGEGLRKVGVQQAGDWLVNDAKQGRQKLDAELKPYSDENPIAAGGGKLAGEVAATLPVGGVLAKGLSKVPGLAATELGGKFINAVGSGGFKTGAPAATTVPGKVADMGLRMAGGATTGGASAALIDPEQAKTGAIVGAALPPSIAALGAGGRLIGNVAKKGAAVVSDKAAKSVAADKVGAAVGDDVTQVMGDLQTYYPKGADNIPISAAGITGKPALAKLEMGSRLRAPENWTDFDLSQSKAVMDNIMTATKDAEKLGGLKDARRANWQEAWAKADSNFKPRVWNQEMSALGPKIQQALKSPEASNPAVKNVLNAIWDEVVRVGPDFSPAHLQQIRANLSGRANPLAPDAFKSAPRDSPAVQSVIAEVDRILDRSTSGKWQKVLEGYAKDSDAVRAAAAASKVRRKFLDPETGQVIGKTRDVAGEVPVITDSRLERAINAARMPDNSLALSPEATNRLTATMDVLRRQQAVQNLKRTATAGGGSDTVPNLLAEGGARAAGAPNLLLQALNAAGKIGTARTDRAVAELLQNPDELARVLSLMKRQPTIPVNLLAPAYRAAPVLAADR